MDVKSYNNQKMRGLVVKCTGSWTEVKTEVGEHYQCKVKGAFRMRGLRSTTPVAVGDRVVFAVDSEGHGLISEVEDRRNFMVRKASNLSKQSQIIAANIDLALLTVTTVHPETAVMFIDRFLAASEAYGVRACLLFNKIDLITERADREYVDALECLYRGIGYECIETSSLSGVGIESVRDLLCGRVVLVSGNSGVGKSTLINTILGREVARTGRISDYHDKGVHTTTFSEMYETGNGGYIIDTPGIRGFGTVEFKRGEVSHYFPEIFRASDGCRFNNCTHVHEPGCAVRKAVEEHRISESRYLSYLSIMDDDGEGKYRDSD